MAVPSAARMNDANGWTIHGPEAPVPRWLENPVDLGNSLPEVDRIEAADLGTDDAAEWMMWRQVVTQAVKRAQDHDRTMAWIDGCIDLLMPVIARDLIAICPRRSGSYAAHARQLSRSERKESRW